MMSVDMMTNMNGVIYDTETALQHAISNVYKEIVELLLDNGADINVKNNNDRTPLHYASIENRKEMEDVIQLLLSKGADINARDSNKTPLHLVSDQGDSG